MDTFDAINQRRSVKAFDPTHRLSATEETKLLEAEGGPFDLAEVVVQDRFA